MVGNTRTGEPAAAIKQVSAEPRARFLAGGTNLIDFMKLDVESPTRLVDVNRIAGLGAVEASMAWAFSSLGVDTEVSVIVTFVYRGLSFWLPFAAGSFALATTGNVLVLTFTPVPEPTSTFGLLFGGVAAGWLLRRRPR